MITFSNILLGKKQIGIELFSANNVDKAACIHTIKKKNELIISKASVYNKEDIPTENKEIPAVIIINTENVLHKEVDGIEPNDRKILNRAFPNLNIDDFYYEIWRKEETSIIAVCRKEYVNKVIESIKTSVTVAGISIGLTSIGTVNSFINATNIITNSFNITSSSAENNLSKHDTFQDTDYNVNGLTVKGSQLLSFSGILSLLIINSNISGNTIDLNKSLKDSFFQNSLFSKGLKTAVFVLLSLLLINFFLFSHYYKKTDETDSILSINKTDIQSVIELKKNIKTKEGKIKEIINNSVFKSSGFINEIVQFLPSSILLDEINYKPLEKNIKEIEKITFLDNLINISGKTLSNSNFTQWIEQIENLKWVESVTIVSFGKNEYSDIVFVIRIKAKQ